jgi:hypothetical protein
MAVGAGITPQAATESAWAQLINLFNAQGRGFWALFDSYQTAIRALRT